ncbi:MAG: glucose-6-phosphate isomerase family protein [Candidatus Methanomethylicaceae archaeon]|nr:glucose-6-phosphate isomerase family protein [Candidatus Verstraetearchaeota archaeon]
MISIKLSFGNIKVNNDLSLSINDVKLFGSYRRLKDLYPVLYDEIYNISEETPLYAMYRGFYLESHKNIFKNKEIRFDLTVMANLYLGRELNKTLGHYHPIAENNLSYPEIYQVLYGKATYLLQKKINDEVIDFIIMNVKEGEAILIPPGYGHVTVNTGETILVMANLVSNKFESIYDDYIKKRGAAYYLLKDGSLIPNKNYKKVPNFRFSSRKFLISKDLYNDFISCPSCFDFLNKPSLLSEKFFNI